MELIRCVDCDTSINRDDWEKHKESKEHILNRKANYVLKIMDNFITLEELNEVVKRRGRDSKHGRITGQLD